MTSSSGKRKAPQSLRGESQQLRGVIFNSRMNSSHGDLFILCYEGGNISIRRECHSLRGE